MVIAVVKFGRNNIGTTGDMQRYKASLSRTQGRSAWAVIFRHPARIDPGTGKGGLRVRQGLGTDDETRANELKEELNALLADEAYWHIAARSEAERRFNTRVVEIFYHGMAPEETDHAAIRDQAVPLPSSRDSEYRRALFLGTTGAGKTTLLRQLIGTDPEREHFPSTSTAKTTVHDTEVVLVDGPYRAAVTFFPVEELREHLNECISAAVLAAYRGEEDREVLRRLLMHVNQRFRFNYVLGNGPWSAVANGDEDDWGDDDRSSNPEPLTPEDRQLDLSQTNALLENAVKVLRDIAHTHGQSLADELGAMDERDQRVIDELFEEELDARLRDDDRAHALADALMDEIEKRFDLLSDGTTRRNKQGWPVCWTWETHDRDDFIRCVNRFSSNYALSFGELLTPLVNGVRVCGPFSPLWHDSPSPKLVLLDGEGLGHTPKSAATISTALTRRIETADAVILVDSATQPMQAAPVAAMRDLVSSGNSRKLIFAFTHFDEVRGPNLLTVSAKEEHVLASAENVLASVGKDLGPYAERALRERLKNAAFFLGGVDRALDATRRNHARTIAQLEQVLQVVDLIVERPAPVEAKPAYDRMNLALAVRDAAEGFHDAWWPRLGLAVSSGTPKEHWSRVKALSRRLATPGMSDEYDNLKPVADLRAQLQDRLYRLIQNPVTWKPREPTEDEKQFVFDALAQALNARILALASRRVRIERLEGWQAAYGQSGRGSSYMRARIIGSLVYDPAAPIPDVTPSPDRNAFLNEVAEAVDQACVEVGARLQ